MAPLTRGENHRGAPRYTEVVEYCNETERALIAIGVNDTAMIVFGFMIH